RPGHGRRRDRPAPGPGSGREDHEMITTEKAPRSRVFPRWPSPITRPGPTPVPRPRRAPKADVSTRARVTELRRQGWTVWFGRYTRQYWAAHTTLMRLVCADTLGELT